MDLKVYALLNAKIKELAGGGLTQAEVEKIVTDEVAKIVAGAPEDFDTLKEMSDWISSHEESAASMNSAIQTNANDISALDTNKVDKVDGKSLISDTEIARLAKVTNYDDSGVKADIQTNADNIDTNKTNISTLAKHISGDLTDSDFQEDAEAVMVKTVPSGMSNYAAVKMIGGKTVKDEENQILKNAVVESVVSTSADGTTETTLLIPDALKSLPDWGCAVNDEIYNYVDFENGIYHHKVGSVDLGSLTWDEFNADRKIYRGVILNLKIVNSDKLSSVICGKYKTVKGSDTWVNGDISTDASSNGNVFICDASYSSVSEFKTAMLGVILNYEFATEELIDISDMLMPIRCESGGTITFNNEHSLDMPNTVVYKKEVSLS